MKRTAKIVIHFGAGVAEVYDTQMQERVDLRNKTKQQKSDIAASVSYISGITVKRRSHPPVMQVA